MHKSLSTDAGGVLVAAVTIRACKGYLRAVARESSLDNLRLTVTKERSHPDYKDIPHEMVREKNISFCFFSTIPFFLSFPSGLCRPPSQIDDASPETTRIQSARDRAQAHCALHGSVGF